MKITKRNLILLILVLVFCIGAGYWAFSIYRVNRTIDQLRSDDWQVREKAMKTLSKLNNVAVGPLITALKDEDADIRWRAAYSLGNIGNSRAVDPLFKVLKDEDKRVICEAIGALGKIGDGRYTALIAALGDDELTKEDISVRDRTKKVLRKIGNEHYVEPLIDILVDKGTDIDVKQMAANALVKVGKPAVEPVITILENNDYDNYTRRKAIEILGRIGDNRVRNPLITILKNSDSLVRIEVVEAFKNMRDIEMLIAILKDENLDVQLKATEALRHITEENFDPDFEKWQNWWKENKDKYITKK